MELRYTRSGQTAAASNWKIYAVCEFERKIEIKGANNRMSIIM